jgi:TRAP-type C4-dicarboxylate transport system permease small subunit
MNAVKIAAIALIVVGVLGLAYGGFSYTSQTHKGQIGPVELSVSEKQTINVPLWASVAAILAGGALLFLRGNRG